MTKEYYTCDDFSVTALEVVVSLLKTNNSEHSIVCVGYASLLMYDSMHLIICNDNIYA